MISNTSFLMKALPRLYANEQQTSTLLSWATGLSILISCLGLLGLAIYTTNQRTKEIGVRKVLGATVARSLCCFQPKWHGSSYWLS